MTADVAAQNLVKWMEDPAVPYGIRAGLAAAQVHRVVAVEADPVETLFASLLSKDGALNPPTPEPPALAQGTVVRAEVLGEGTPEPDDDDEDVPLELPTRKNPHVPPHHIKDGLLSR